VEIELRPAESEDAPGLARVSVDSWQTAYRGLVSQSFLDSLNYEERERAWRERLTVGDEEWWGLLVDGRVAGFVALCPASPEDGGPRVGELHGIYLHPDFFDRGLGRRLMELALARLRLSGHPEAVLWVIDGNRRAERFYKAAGWTREDAVRPHPRVGVPLRRHRLSLL
jgi:ribosomal protein S18 acetylase RimI-like enzyme